MAMYGLPVVPGLGVGRPRRDLAPADTRGATEGAAEPRVVATPDSVGRG